MTLQLRARKPSFSSSRLNFMIRVEGARDISNRDGHMRRTCNTDERMSNAGLLPCDAFHAS